MRICSKLLSIRQEHNYFCLTTNCIDIHLYFLTDSILRIRAGFDGDFFEESYSLLTTAWDDRLDFLLKGQRQKVTAASASLTEDENTVTIRGARLCAVIEKEPFTVRIYDISGTLLHADIPDLAYMEDSNRRRIHTVEIFPGDHFYGFGEKSGTLNKAETFMSMSPKDAMGYNPKKTDSLYKHIPFYIRLNEFTKKATGYFYHNTCECDFDMGREKSNYWKPHSRYRTDGGDIDLFFIEGPAVRDVICRYTDLTGKPALLPKYALGYLGSSMYYPELPADCDDAIVDFIDTTREERIPVDGFQLSSGYTSQQTKDGERRCVFTWNHRRFKDPADFFARMKQRGITVSPNVKPGVLLTHPRFSQFAERDIFVKDSETENPCVGTWWGGKGVFADFTNPDTRRFWKKELTEHVLHYGTSSVWNDNCEYDSIVDKDARCDFDGRGGTIGQLKSVMPNLMCQVTAEAIEEAFPGRRPFIVCRSGHAGIQRYAQTWAGDNLTCWDALKYNIATILGMSLCGVPNYGCDIGGFYGVSPEPELFVRWVQNGIFQPRFSIHSVNTDNTVTEPWMYEGCTAIIRDAIRFRYRLFPYYYSLTARAHEMGLPVLEPLCSAFQEDPACYDDGINFMVGDALLAATVVEKHASAKTLYLPKGYDFYDFYTRTRYVGGQTVTVPVTLNDIPIFIKSGAILPMAGNQLSNLTTEHVTSLVLLCCADRDNTFTLYEDDGITKDYENGDFLKTVITMKCAGSEDCGHDKNRAGDKNLTEFSFSHTGSYQSTIRNVELDVICPKNAPFHVIADGELLPHFLHRKKYEDAASGWYFSQTNKSVLIKYRNPLHDYKVAVSFEPFDMIGM